MNAPVEKAPELSSQEAAIKQSEPVKGVPHIFMALRDVQEAIAKVGIAKLRRNKDQGYDFRGIDDVYNELCGLLAAAFVVTVPRVVEHKQQIGKTGTGKPMMMTTVTVEYDFYSAKDGSKVTARTVGEGFDMSDKSSNKSMSAAHKYALIQTFNIPIVGKDDADNDDHRLGAEKQAKVVTDAKKGKPEGGKPAEKPALIPEPTNVDPATTVAAMVKALGEAKDEPHLRALFAKYTDSIKKWTSFSPKQRQGWIVDHLTPAKEKRKQALVAGQQQTTGGQQ